MKKLTTKIITLIAFTAMMLTITPMINIQSVQAAPKAQGTVDLKAKKLIIPKGKTQKIKNKKLAMVKGRRYQVKAKFGNTVVSTKGTYKSNKPAVATVSSTGLVTAKAPGNATIKVTYGGKSQTFKIKVIASHTHTLKTVKKATCASKGTKLCTTCGATGTIKKSTKHNFKVTKKATCETKGVQTCSVCGVTESIAKTAHEYVTETSEYIEGRGTPYYEDEKYCNGCGIDMSHWSIDEASAHWVDIAGMQAGTTNEECWSAGYNAAAGVEKYPKYVVNKTVETYCKHCGAWKNKTSEDLYEVYYDEWRNVVRKSDGKILEESVWYKKAKPYLEKAAELNGTAKTATAKAVAQPEDVINTIPNADVADTDIVIDETVSENAVISDNTIIID